LRAKEFLSREGINFEAVDVINDPGGRERLLKLGVRNLPVVARGSEYVMGQSLEDVAKFVGVKTGHQRLPPAEIIEKWIVALRAAQRYMRQFPTARINESAVENRERPIRLLGHHVFYIAEAYLKAVTEKIEYSPANTNVPAADEKKYKTGDEIARYGEGIIADLRGWWEREKDISFAQRVPTSYGEQELHEVFERSTWHSAQHVRQLGAVLERFGIPPEGQAYERRSARLAAAGENLGVRSTSRRLVTAAAMLMAGAACAQSYPVKPIRLVVVSAPGGTTDALARAFSQRLTDNMGQAVVVDNKPGGGGVIAAETVVRAAPDGYTLLLANLAHSLMSTLHSKLSFDPLRDFTPVAFMGLTDSVLVTNVNVPVKTVSELIAYAKARPGGLNYAGGTTGATAHLSGELFKMMTGLNITHVPYKGTAAAITALIGGEAQMAFLSLPPCVPLIQSGRLRGIAIGSAERSQAVPGPCRRSLNPDCRGSTCRRGMASLRRAACRGLSS
jgi:tripartite-type tricarboxylate transporter receptor subunit TctC